MQGAARPARVQAVLIVEDEHEVCGLLSEMIEDAGYGAVCVNSDADAYEALRTGRGYAALVVDINLGSGTTGFDVARFARQVEPTLAILYVSGQAEERSFSAFGVPNSEFVMKPFSGHELRRRLLKAMGKDAA